MTIRFLLPPASGERSGNAVTSERWRGFLEALGHRVVYEDEPCDVLVAFNAYKTRWQVLEAAERGTAGKTVLCLTGTDLYGAFLREPDTGDVLFAADLLVVLHPLAVYDVPPVLRVKTRVVCQSALPPPAGPGPTGPDFDVCVIAHLRDVKDPLRAAFAARLVPEGSRVRVLHAGKALSDAYAGAARREAEENPRYHWLGEKTREETAQVLAGCRLLVLSSVLEGGANVLSEAVVAGVPVLSTDIACARGLLGEDYPGLFPVGDTERLAELLSRAETDPAYYEDLRQRCQAAAWRFEPEREREALRALLEEL